MTSCSVLHMLYHLQGMWSFYTHEVILPCDSSR